MTEWLQVVSDPCTDDACIHSITSEKHNVSRETLCFFYDDGRKRVVKKSVMLYNRITAEKKSAKLLR